MRPILESIKVETEIKKYSKVYASVFFSVAPLLPLVIDTRHITYCFVVFIKLHVMWLKTLPL